MREGKEREERVSKCLSVENGRMGKDESVWEVYYGKKKYVFFYVPLFWCW